MAEMRTDEEQVEAIKDWWKRNGSSLLIGIVAALAIVFGWQAWQDHQAEKRSVAAAQFSKLVNSLGEGSDEERTETVGYLAKELQENFEDSAYAIYATLILAQQQLMDQAEPEAAEASLEWAHARVEGGSALELIVRSRLAQAQFAAGRHDEALETLDGAGETGEFAGIYSELQGDILLAKGDRAAAEEAYRSAREASTSGQNGLLELKLSDLAIGEDV
ncbi:MAG: tetratricopeptide repeat protein [Marinobacter sp.]|uniref:YfgM family protein n=1 Tax=Marinobacter sp. TaxID=50741 RepID=UPI0034A0117F